MKTYNTYQEAKIANPKSEIVTTAPNWDGRPDYIGVFEPLTFSHWLDNDSGWIKCHPKDYCMSLAEFLADGRELVNGDVYLDIFGNNMIVGDDVGELVASNHHKQDRNRYILRAKALEQAEIDTTPQQVESLAAYELYCARCDAIEWENKYTFHEFQQEEDSFKGWIAVVRKTKYRKQ